MEMNSVHLYIGLREKRLQSEVIWHKTPLNDFELHQDWKMKIVQLQRRYGSYKQF